jgi:catechol 2,3-dioxygenase-like lactoylglutathione lyase family enzyme
MPNLSTIELKAFVPARDFALSKRFYEALGFVSPWSDETLAYLHHGNVAFFLQNFYVEQLASNFMMHLLVEDVDAWHARVTASGVVEQFQVKLSAVQLQPWRMREFTLHDPSGVLWRIGQNVA